MWRYPRGVLRVLRAIFAPIASDLWIYLAAPTFFVIGALTTDPGQSLPFYLERFGIAFVAVTCVGLPAHLVYEHWAWRKLVGPFSWRELPLHAAIVVGSVIAGTELAVAILLVFARPETATPERITGFRLAAWGVGSLGVATVSGIAVTVRRYRTRIEEVEQRESEARQASLAAQVRALQARIQPHFLFNCLNTVAGLVEEDPPRAGRAIEKLSDLFRYTLAASKQREVPLSDELAVVRDFLDLETLRYGDRLKTALHIDPDSAAVPVPPLLLQPLVENAVLHGIARREEGGRLELETRLDGDTLRVSVEDDGPGPGQSDHVGSGSALRDLRERISLIYGDDAEVREARGVLGGYRIEVLLPRVPPLRPGLPGRSTGPEPL